MAENESEHEIADLSLRIKGSRKLKEPGGARKSLKGTFKLAVALLIVALVLAAIAAGIGGVVYLWQKARNRPLAEPKFWRDITVQAIYWFYPRCMIPSLTSAWKRWPADFLLLPLKVTGQRKSSRKGKTAM